MKRRNFIVSSGVALGGASAAIGLLQEPATALDFTIDGYDVSSAKEDGNKTANPVSNLEDVSEVNISFDTFNLKTQYLDTSKTLTIQMDLDLKDKGGQVVSSSETYQPSFSNGSSIDGSSFGSPAISVSNVGSNVNLQYYKDNVYTDGMSDDKIYEKITVRANLTVTVSHDDLSSDKVHTQQFYISESPHGLYDVVTRYGDKKSLFNSYEKRILESYVDTNDSNDPDSAIFELDTENEDGDDVNYIEGLLSFHVASTSGFVTSSKKMEAIARDSNNERVARESYVNGDGPNVSDPTNDITAKTEPASYSYADDKRDETGAFKAYYDSSKTLVKNGG